MKHNLYEHSTYFDLAYLWREKDLRVFGSHNTTPTEIVGAYENERFAGWMKTLITLETISLSIPSLRAAAISQYERELRRVGHVVVPAFVTLKHHAEKMYPLPVADYAYDEDWYNCEGTLHAAHISLPVREYYVSIDGASKTMRVLAQTSEAALEVVECVLGLKDNVELVEPRLKDDLIPQLEASGSTPDAPTKAKMGW